MLGRLGPGHRAADRLSRPTRARHRRLIHPPGRPAAGSSHRPARVGSRAGRQFTTGSQIVPRWPASSRPTACPLSRVDTGSRRPGRRSGASKHRVLAARTRHVADLVIVQSPGDRRRIGRAGDPVLVAVHDQHPAAGQRPGSHRWGTTRAPGRRHCAPVRRRRPTAPPGRRASARPVRPVGRNREPVRDFGQGPSNVVTGVRVGSQPRTEFSSRNTASRPAGQRNPLGDRDHPQHRQLGRADQRARRGGCRHRAAPAPPPRVGPERAHQSNGLDLAGLRRGRGWLAASALSTVATSVGPGRQLRLNDHRPATDDGDRAV